MSKPASIFVFALSGLFFLFFFIWPIGETIRGAFLSTDGSFTLAYVAEVFRNPIYLEGLQNAFLLAAASTALSLLIALPLASISDRYLCSLDAGFFLRDDSRAHDPPALRWRDWHPADSWSRGALNVVLQNLHLLSAPVDWLGEGRFWGVAVMNALHLYPILYLNVVAALANIDPAMEEAAENLGCRG